MGVKRRMPVLLIEGGTWQEVDSENDEGEGKEILANGQKKIGVIRCNF